MISKEHGNVLFPVNFTGKKLAKVSDCKKLCAV